ncbi:MAG: AhpC/TSA family protein [Bacteroidales bacterium]|nr:AhpC/TSA family protein [Bacteroidales bacterium]
MKRIILFLMLPFVALSCTDRTFRINGIYTTGDGTEVYLINQQTKDTVSTTAVKDGRFTFEGETKEPFYAYVGNGRERIHLILEPGTAIADIDERVASGTPLTDSYADFHKRFYGYTRDQKKEKAALTDSMVMANRDNLAGAVALEDLAYVDTTRFLELYSKSSDLVRDFYLVKSAYEAIQIQNQTAPGRMFTDYTVKGGNPDGTDVSLSDYVGRGKYILLDHWASWCGPCKAEMPIVKKTWEAFHGDRFDVVSIAVSDKREDTIEALSRLDMPWNQIYDGQKIPRDVYGVSAIPHLILFAPDGTILRRGLRGQQIYDTVAEILASE